MHLAFASTQLPPQPLQNSTFQIAQQDLGRQDVEDMEHGMYKCLRFSILGGPVHADCEVLTLFCLQKQKAQSEANADAAAGNKKKKVTAAQLRVQKGTVPPSRYAPRTFAPQLVLTFAPRSFRTRASTDDEDDLQGPRRCPELRAYHRTGRGNVQGRAVSLHVRGQPGVPPCRAQGPLQGEDIPPQYRFAGQSVSEHLARGLEAGIEHTSRYCWSTGMDASATQFVSSV